MKSSEKDLRDVLALDTPGKGCKNYSIKAGAGGGKTTLLSTRICKQIIAGTPIEEFVIITYTNAAAAELRDKISDRLSEVLTSTTASESERNNAKEALNSIELMQISTIHSFLLKILREHAFETGIALDVRMLEQEEDDARKKRFFNKRYHEHFDEIQKYKWIYEPQNGNERDVTHEVFLNMFLDIVSVREEIEYDMTDHTAEFERAGADYIAAWLPELSVFNSVLKANWRRKTDGSISYQVKNWAKIIKENVSYVEGASDHGIEEAKLLSDAVRCIKEWIEAGTSIYGYNTDDSALYAVTPEIPEYELDWNYKKLYDDYCKPAEKASKVVDYVCNMQKKYQKLNDAETLSLSNDDILFRADKLLSDHPEVLDKLRGTYTKLYVDEFQDTTGLQTRLVKMLSERIGTDPGAYDLQEDKLIVVGDPKQSIYRFTGAEKAVYDGVDAMMAGLSDSLAESVSLDTNFRSNKDIVEWVNDKYSKLMPSSYSPMDTDWVVSEPNALHGVYKYVADLGGDRYEKKNDVAAVVELVQSLVGKSHCFIEEPDRKDADASAKPHLRKIRYSDIMIICKYSTHIKDYVEKFDECGIPVTVQGKLKVSGDEIVRNFALLVEYLAGYKNKKKRLTAVQILSGLDASKIDADELKNAENQLRDLRAYFREKAMDPAAIMRYLLSKEELFLPKGKPLPVERVRQYRIRLNQMVETCLMQNDGDMSQLSALMNDYVEKEIKREIPLESNENAVRLMNVHQSKGLTGKIVIIADRSNEEKCGYDGFKSDGKYYPSVHFKTGDGEFASTIYVPSYGWDIDRLKQAYKEETEEAIRLQYVAATRAAHALIIMPLVYGNHYPNAWFSDANYQYGSLPDINEWIRGREADTKTYSLVSQPSSGAKMTHTLHDLEKNKASVDISTITKGRFVSITPSGLEPEGVTGYSSGDPGYNKENRPVGPVFGTVMHRVYELMFLRYDPLKKMSATDREKAIERIINQAILESSDDLCPEDKPKEFSDFLRLKMSVYFDKIVTPIMADADEIYPEYAFSFFVEDTDRAAFISDFDSYFKNAKDAIIINSEPIWINGKADLVVRKKDGSIKVYDYKSDAMNGKDAASFAKSLEKKYEGQLALYRYAIGKSFDVSDVQTELIDLYRQ